MMLLTTHPQRRARARDISSVPGSSPFSQRVPLMLPTFDQLCLAFTLALRQLPEHTSAAQQRVLLIDLAHMTVMSQRAPGHMQEGLSACWHSYQFRDLHARQRHLLVFFGALAAAAWGADEAWARMVVARTYVAALSVWSPSAWQPWMGPRPETRPRRSVRFLEDGMPAEDPTGDPMLSGSVSVEVEGSTGHWSWYSIGQILDGLDHWGDVLQTHLHLPLGDMLRLGSPDWARFIVPRSISPELPADVEISRAFKLAFAV